MAPKQKVSDNGAGTTGGGNTGKGGSGGNSNNNNNTNGGERQRDNDRSNANGHADRTGSSSTGGAGGAGSGANGANGGNASQDRTTEKGSSSNAGAGIGTKRKAESPTITVEFSTMDVATLRRYCRLNKLKPRSKSQEDLALAASKHFEKPNPTKEIDSVAYFLFAVKHRHNVLKLTMPLP